MPEAILSRILRIRPYRKSSNGDGRPSIGTITEQWEFMRINFVNNSDEVIA